MSEQRLLGLGLSLAQVRTFIEEAKPTAELRLILDNLSARGLQNFVKVDYGVIRGLAYYTGPVFEAFDRKSEFRAIAGGGRYDNLVGLLSGGKVNLPALGFGMGDVVLRELLKARQRLPAFSSSIYALCLIEDENLRAESLRLIHELRAAGLSVDYALTPARPDKQFKRAQELGVTVTIKLERAESSQLTVKVRNLKARQERIIPRTEVAKQLVAEMT